MKGIKYSRDKGIQITEMNYGKKDIHEERRKNNRFKYENQDGIGKILK